MQAVSPAKERTAGGHPGGGPRARGGAGGGPARVPRARPHTPLRPGGAARAARSRDPDRSCLWRGGTTHAEGHGTAA